MTVSIPTFEAPWHAQAFALAVHLNEQGLFDWPSWTATFSQTLSQHGMSKSLDGGDDYFLAWVETIEIMLEKAGHASPGDVSDIKAEWKNAYLSTPHGRPVNL